MRVMSDADDPVKGLVSCGPLVNECLAWHLRVRVASYARVGRWPWPELNLWAGRDECRARHARGRLGRTDRRRARADRRAGTVPMARTHATHGEPAR